MSLIHKTALDISLIFIRNNVPNDISCIVFNFLEEDIKQQENKNYLTNKVKQFVNNSRWSRDYNVFTFHFNELPYFKNIYIHDKNKDEIKNVLVCSLNAISNKKYMFTNYCCGGKGIVIEPIKERLAQCCLVHERY